MDDLAAEPSDAGAFKFTRTGGDGSPVTVQYSVGGSAESGVDYAALSGQVVVPGGGTLTDVDFLELPHEEVRVGLQPVYLHEGDFNRDGNLDLAVVSHQAVPGNLTIHMGNGAGGFDEPVYYSTIGISPRSIEVADFNEDGELDIAVANRNSSDVAVFLGNASGTFPATPVLYNVGSYPRMVNAADFNEDGSLDLITANYHGQNVTLWLGDGAGGFNSRTDFTTSPPGKSSHPRSMVVEDFNEDGHMDVAVSSSSGENVSILLGDGAGSFSVPTSVAWGPGNEYTLNLTSADLNSDGHLDLVTANYFGSSLSVLMGDGTGTFSGPQHIDLGDNEFEPRYVTTGDFNSDGFPDLAAADAIQVRIGILLGDGTGSFGPREDFELLPPGTLPYDQFNASLVVSDFDDDGDSDFAAIRDYESFAVLLNQSAASSSAIVSVDVIDDQETEVDETVAIELIADDSYELVGLTSATVTITNNDGPELVSSIPEAVAKVQTEFQFDVAEYFNAETDLTFAASKNDIELLELATGLESPVQIVSADDGSGRVFVVEQTGQVRILRHGTAGPDAVPPVVSNVFPSATDSAAIIQWASDEDTTGYVEYGTTIGFGSVSELDSTLDDYHRSSLPDLDPDTQYYLRVVATDAAGNTTTSPQFSFVTESVPVAGEVLYNGIVLPQQWPPPPDPTQVPEVAPYLVSPPEIIDIDVGRQLFVDAFLIEDTTLTRSPHRPQFYDANPILAPGDVHDFNHFAMPNSDGVWYDADDGLFKMWYMGSHGNMVSYAYSTDGMNWIKPELPNSIVFPNSNTVVQIGGARAATTVWLDPLAQDPNRKFQLFASKGSRFDIWYSPDGIAWTKDTKTVPNLADRSTMFYNPFRGVWVSSLRSHTWLVAAGDRDTYKSRTRSYAESSDLANFTPIQYWTGPDLLDPIYYDPIGEYPELYNLDAVAYESLMVGLFSWWNPGAPYPGYDELGPRVNEIGVGFSRDGYHWERPTRGGGDEAFIPASKDPNSWNGYNTQSAGGAFLVVGDELWFYFSGRTQKKPFFGDMSTGLAKLRRDGFYSMDASATEGTLTTRPVQFSGHHLFVNVDNPAGQLQVEILDVDGNVIAPFSRANSVPVSADKTLVEVNWNGVNDLSTLAGTPVRFRFYLTDGELYSFWVSDSTSGASDGYIAAGGPGLTGTTDTVGTAGYTPSGDATNPQNERIVTPTPTAPANVQPAPFLDISGRVDKGFGKGLQSIAFHPQFADPGAPGEGKLYVLYNAPPTLGGGHDTVLSELSVSTNDPNLVDTSSERELLRLSQPDAVGDGGSGPDGIPLNDSDIGRKGGGMSFGPDDGLLYISTGSSEFVDAQDLDSLLGKVLRIDVDGTDGPNGQYGVPVSNPFVGVSGVRDEIYASGFHHPRHLSFDDGPDGPSSPDRLFVTDVGDSLFEEVNLVVSGGNYGWAYREATQAILPGAPSDLIDPIAAYSKTGYGEGVVGGNIYRGSGVPAWDGRYLMGDTIGQFKTLVGGASWRIQDNATLREVLLSVGSISDDVYVTTPNTVYQVTTQPSSLPDWLAFDSAAGIFSGTPEITDLGTISIEVIATDTRGDSVSSTFDLTVDDGVLPLVTISATDAFANEPAGDGELTFSRTGDVSASLTVHYSVSGNATAGADYTSLGTSITIPIGSYSVTTPVAVIDDSEVEFDESVLVTLQPDSAYDLTPVTAATVMIISDEQYPTIDLVVADGALGEPDDDGLLTIARTGDDSQPLTVYFTVAGNATSGSDFDSIGNSVEIPSGSPSVDIPINVNDDSHYEGEESIIVTLDGRPSYALGTSISAELSIAENDVPAFPVAGLSGHWTLDETSGSIAADTSGNGHHGVVGGSALWTPGRVNGGLDFDGSDDIVDIGTGPAIVGTGGFTVSTWLKTTAAADQFLVQQRSPQGYNGEYVLQLSPSGHVSFWTFGGFAMGPRVTSTQAVNDGQWHHVTAVREDDGTMTLYIDGILDVSTAGAPRPLVALGVYLGADGRDNNRFFNGTLDDVRIWDRALTAIEVSLLTIVDVGLDAVNDTYTAHEDNAVSVVAPGFLSNDQGADLSLTSVDSASQMGLTVTSGSDGSFGYDPTGQFQQLSVGEVGNDTFTYSITDGTNVDTATVTISVQGRNDGPTAAVDFGATTEDASLNINVVANDSDIDQLDTLSVISVNDTGILGVITFAGGTVTYDPNRQFESLAQGASVSESFSYTVSDGNGGTASASVEVTVTGVNDPPVADPDSASTDEATAITIAVLTGDTDVDSSVLNVTSAGAGALGSVSINPDHTLVYDPNGQFDDLMAGQTATDNFIYTITDDFGATSTAQVSIVISGSSVGPAAVDDNASTDEESTVSVNVLVNDTDGGPLGLVVTTVDNTGTVGVATRNPDDTIAYDPNGQFEHLAVGETATDIFSYTISDGIGGTDTATVTITIDGVNDPPDAVDDQYSVIAGDVLSVAASGVLTNDTDVDLSTTGFLFAAPDGSPSGDGSFNAPWDLTTLFSHPPELQPGDTVYLRGGTYSGAPDSNIAGTESLPITIQSYPGEHAQIDVYAPATFGDDRIIGMFGDYVDWVNLEFMSSDPHSRITSIPAHGYPDINRGTLSVQGSNNNFINNIFHDMESGIGFWSDGTGGEIYGAIIYNNGWVGPDRPHGHGIYVHNELGTKRIADSIIFNQFSHGIHAYGTSLAQLKNLDFEGNVSFNNGGGSGQGFIPGRDILVGGGSRAENIRVANNYTYQNNQDGVIGFGFLTAPDNDNIEIVDNYFVGEVSFYSGWEDVTYTGNTNYNAANILVSVELATGVTTADYTWDQNEYFTPFGLQFRLDGENYWFEHWQTTTGLDSASTYTAAAPSGVEVFVRPNEYEVGRGNVVVYNWDLAANVDVDLSTVLQVGDAYEIRNAVDVDGDPVMTGIFDGNLVSVPMAAVVAPSPIGYTAQSPIGTGPEFGVFIVTTPTTRAVGSALSVTSFDATSAQGATVSIDSSGSFFYDATGLAAVQALGANEVLEDTLTYTISDSDGGTDTATVTVTISGENHPPNAEDDNKTTDEDSAVSIDILANDSDNDVADSISVQSVDDSLTQGVVTLHPDNTITYDPSSVFHLLSAGETEVETFIYSIVDGFGETDWATVTVTVTGVNDDPTAQGDTASTGEDDAITIDVMNNDSDPDRLDVLSVLSVNQAGTAGTVAINQNGTLSYDPNGQFEYLSVGQAANDTFTYTVDDQNGGTHVATVTVTVSGANDGPQAAPDSVATNEDSSISISVLLGDTDDDQLDVLSLLSIDATGTSGSISIGPNDTVIYDPSGNYEHLPLGQSSLDTFIYTVSDGNGGTDTATVSVTVNGVNDAPTSADNSATTDEDTATTITVLAGDSDPDDSDVLTVIGINDSGTVGAVTLNPDGTVGYNPIGAFDDLPVGATEQDIFNYTIDDVAGETSTANVTVVINGVNDAPIVGNDTAVTDERSDISIDVLAGDDDPDNGDVLTVVGLDDASTLGTVALNAGTVTYDPDGQFNGLEDGQTATDSFGYQISDGNGGLQWGTVVVTINGLDAPPAPIDGLVAYWPLNDGAGTVAEDESGNGNHGNLGGNPVWSGGNLDGGLTFDGFGDNIDAGLGPSIIGTGGFTVSAWVQTSAIKDQVIIQQRSSREINGEYMLHVTSSGQIGFWTFGGYAFGPRVSTVRPIRDGLWHHVVAVREDDGTSKIYVDGVLEASKTGTPRPLVPINVYLGADMRGSSRFLEGSLDDVRIYDQSLDHQQVQDLFLYRPEVDPGLGVDDTYATDEETSLSVAASGMLANDIGAGLSVAELDRVSAAGVAVSGGSDGAFQYSSAGQFEYLAHGEVLSDTFAYTVTDGTLTDVATVSISISGVNDAPVVSDDSAATDEASPVTITVLSNDFDVDLRDVLSLDDLDWTATTGVVTENPNGTITYDPGGAFESLALGESIEDTLAYTVVDGNGGSGSAMVSVTINGLNDLPEVMNDAADTDEETAILISVLSNDSDVDASDILMITAINDSGTLGNVSINQDAIAYDPAGEFDNLVEGETAFDTFEYTVSDGNGGELNATVTVSISGIGLELAAVDDDDQTAESASVIVNVLANDLDGGSPFGLTIQSVNTVGTAGIVQQNLDTVSYDPNGQFESLSVGETAMDSFSYTISDGQGGSDTATVTITVLGENDAPTATDDDVATDEDHAISIAVMANDDDPDSVDSLRIQNINRNGTVGTVIQEQDGSITYDPAGQFEYLVGGETAFDSFVYTLSDGRGGTDMAVVSVTIQGVDESTVPTDGLVAHWSLDDGAGTVARDLSGNDHHGTVGGNPVWSAGAINGGLDLDGYGDHINAGVGPSMVGTGGFTVTAWVKTSSTSNQVIIQQRSTQEINGQYQLHITAGRVRFWTFGGSAYGPRVLSSQRINDGQWRHVAGVREDDGTTKIYIDGAIDGVQSGTPRPLVPINVYVGADMRGPSAFLKGSLDDVRIYDRALDTQEVFELANYQPASSTVDVLALVARSNRLESGEYPEIEEHVDVPPGESPAFKRSPARIPSFQSQYMRNSKTVESVDMAFVDSDFVDGLSDDLYLLMQQAGL